ncbi:MAG: Asp23/Gls24 family envelope stress response protein [Oscillospiraceae bacterium]
MIRYGYVLAEVAGKVQKTVLAALQDMTGFTIRSVNVMIGGICFD